MIVRMWMQREVIVVGPHDSVMDAATLMAKRHIRRLPVVEKHAEGAILAGIVAARDILHAFPPDVNPFAVAPPEATRAPVLVGEIMSRYPVTTTPETPIEEAATLMHDRKIGALPVVRDKRRLVGLITESDIFRAFVGFFGSAEPGVRVTFDTSKGEDVFGFVALAAQKRNVRVISLVSSHQDDCPVCVVRLAGGLIEGFLEELWSSHHTVLNVVRFD